MNAAEMSDATTKPLVARTRRQPAKSWTWCVKKMYSTKSAGGGQSGDELDRGQVSCQCLCPARPLKPKEQTVVITTTIRSSVQVVTITSTLEPPATAASRIMVQAASTQAPVAGNDSNIATSQVGTIVGGLLDGLFLVLVVATFIIWGLVCKIKGNLQQDELDPFYGDPTLSGEQETGEEQEIDGKEPRRSELSGHDRAEMASESGAVEVQGTRLDRALTGR